MSTLLDPFFAILFPQTHTHTHTTDPYQNTEERKGSSRICTVANGNKSERSIIRINSQLVSSEAEAHKPHECPQSIGHCVHKKDHLLNLMKIENRYIANYGQTHQN